jgi:hypothetical protein
MTTGHRKFLKIYNHVLEITNGVTTDVAVSWRHDGLDLECYQMINNRIPEALE